MWKLFFLVGFNVKNPPDLYIPTLCDAVGVPKNQIKNTLNLKPNLFMEQPQFKGIFSTPIFQEL